MKSIRGDENTLSALSGEGYTLQIKVNDVSLID